MKMKPTAMAIDKHLKPTSVNLLPIFHSLEDTYDVMLNMSYCGITVHQRKRAIGCEPVQLYKDGEYRNTRASNEEERATYRFRLICFLRWAMVNMNTPELEKNKAWINDQLH